MPGNSITAANAVFSLTIPGVFTTPQVLQQFSADDIFDTDALPIADISMGVDGTLSAGYVFEPIRQSIALQANSPSNKIFDDLYQAEQTLRDKYQIFGIVLLPSVNAKWTLVNGYCVTFPPMPNARRVLQPRRYGLAWNQVIRVPA